MTQTKFDKRQPYHVTGGIVPEQRSSIMESNSFWSKEDSVSNTARKYKEPLTVAVGSMNNTSKASVRDNSKGKPKAISKERRAIIKKV